MNRRIFYGALTALSVVLFASASAAQADELRVMVHSSFSLPKPLLAQFESQSGVKLSIIKGGDAGEMLNKLILTRANPVADVVFGIDNTLMSKALATQVVAANDTVKALATASGDSALGQAFVAVDYGFVTLNYDKAFVAKSGLALPKTLEELTQTPYRNWLAAPNPATSSPGYAFMLATIAALGEGKAFDWWARMRANGLKVTKGWTEAYYTEFSRNGGTRPLVVSYATSPAAEVFYSKEKISEPPTGSLALKGGTFRQTEGVALVKGGGQREAAVKFIEFLRSAPVQEALQTSMWMFPADPRAPRVDVMRHASEPAAFDSLSSEVIAAKGSEWVNRWVQVVLK